MGFFKNCLLLFFPFFFEKEGNLKIALKILALRII